MKKVFFLTLNQIEIVSSRFQQQFQPKNNQPRAYQQNFYNNGQSENKALSEQQLQDVYALRCVLGAIFYNQSCFTANMNLLNDPSLTFPAMNLALQGLQNSAANILNMTVNYTNLMTQAFLRSQLMSNHSQNVAQDKPGRFIYGAQQQELVDVETVKDLKQEKQDNCQNEAIEVSKEAAEVAQVKTRGLQKENFAEKAEMRPPLLKKGFVVDIHVLSVEPSLRFKFTYDDYGLAKLMKELQTLYSSIDSESKLAYDHIQPGSTVAAKIFDVWHRAKVISGLDKEGKIELEFIDFGTRQKLPTKDVRHLCSKFKQDPIRFYHGQCVLPAFVSSTPEAAQKFFAEKSLNTKLYAKVVGFSGDLCQMKVYDANGVDFFSDLIKLKV